MEAGTQPPVTPEPEGGKQEEGKEKEQAVPYDRFKEVNARAKQAEEDLAEMRKKILEFEDRDKSDVERERAARERAESQLQDLMGKVTGLEKGAWVRSAAAELKFHDPEDAVAHLHSQLAGLEDQREAKRLVERLARTKEHLVQQEEKRPPRPAIGQVFAGQDTGTGKGEERQPTMAERQAQQQQQFAEGLRAELQRFLPENADSFYKTGD